MSVLQRKWYGSITEGVRWRKREMLLPEDYKSKTTETLRWLLIEVAGKVVRHGRRLILLLSTTIDKLNLYRRMRQRCMAFG